MSKIISIGTAVPEYRHNQKDILTFMQRVYAMNEAEKRKLRFLYNQSAIDTRYSVLPDYTVDLDDWQFYPASENLSPFPNLEKRMEWYNKTAPGLSVNAIKNCLGNKWPVEKITHLITVSCTGLSAPGLDLQILESMNLSPAIFRTSVNFMGCYAAIHALKLAHAICNSEQDALVIIVCTELCTLHFQRENNMDNIASSLLFGDGSAAVLVGANGTKDAGVAIKNFYSEVSSEGKNEMSWQLSSSGFLMKLSGYIPDLIQKDFNLLLENALRHAGMTKEEINFWCLHPGGKKILTAIEKSIDLNSTDLQASYNVLRQYGNMSSATILFVLQEILISAQNNEVQGNIFGAAFGPGLTMETFILGYD
ncbi:type III polyketide synthase [soil metagenome]